LAAVLVWASLFHQIAEFSHSQTNPDAALRAVSGLANSNKV
jgi:hypothetical protein